MRHFTAGVLSLLSLLTIQFGCSETSNNDANAKVATVAPKIKFKLVAAIIKNDGSIIPVPKTEFQLNQVSEEKIRLGIRKRLMRDKPLLYEKYKPDCLKKHGPGTEFWIAMHESKDEKFIDLAKREVNDCIKSKFEEEWYINWDIEAGQKFDQMQKKYPQVIKVTTDLSGEAMVEAPPGIWYISGRYSFNKSSEIDRIKSLMTWDYEVEVKPGLKKVELSNDNKMKDENWSLD